MLRSIARPAAVMGVLLTCLAGYPVASAGAAVATKTFTDTGGSQLYVPDGVHKLTVKAIGGQGGSGCAGPGGYGFLVIATVPVTPGQHLYVGVAGDGGSCPDGSAGFGGGGKGGPVLDTGGARTGGGGGASVVSEHVWFPGQPGPAPLVLAGGGGGGGGGARCCDRFADGQPGTLTSGGKGGTATGSGVVPGHDGSFGIGGDGATSHACMTVSGGFPNDTGGGGGGGGYYGGGGGAACTTAGYGAGRGGPGSSFVDAAGDTELGPVAVHAEPSVRLIYPVPVVTLSARSERFGQQAVGTTSAAQTLTITNRGSAPLVISRVEVAGHARHAFVLDDRCEHPIARRSDCHIEVRFEPGQTGRRTARLRLVTNAAHQPRPIRLAGRGEPASRRGTRR
jgi:hypothetical protein